LQDVIKHAKPNQGHLEVQEQLRVIIERVLSHTRDLERTLAMDNFLPLLDLLEKAAKTQVAKQILEALGRSEMTASDPVLLHTLFDVSRSLHDSIDSLSFSDERRQIAGLITVFVRRIDFGRDLEKQLNTYVECRQAFSNLDTVTQELVLRTALLATKAHRFMKGKHNKKTAAFVKACLAYCHITIASLEDVFARLRLFVNCGEVAIMNGMVVQGEAFFKAAVSLIPEVPPQVEVNLRARSTEDDLAQFLCCFASTLLAVPGHPQHGPFFLVKGLLNAIQQYAPWNGRATPAKARVYLAMLQLFCAYAQRAFPYHIIGVESNDRLYGGDEEYMGQIAVFVDTLVNELLAQLSDIGEAQDLASRKEQGTLALDLVNALVGFLEMNAHSATLVVKLFQLAQKSQAASTRYLNATLAHIQSKPGSWYADIAQKIVSLSGAADGAT
jgi:heme oxygenase